MSPALFSFELLKMSKLTRGPLVLYHLPKYWSRKKNEAKNVKKKKKKNNKKNNNIISRFQEHTYILRSQAKGL